jgi:hypothetical protein
VYALQQVSVAVQVQEFCLVSEWVMSEELSWQAAGWHSCLCKCIESICKHLYRSYRQSSTKGCDRCRRSSPCRCRPRGRLCLTRHPGPRLGCLCERIAMYHHVCALRRANDCRRSGCCDGHPLLTGFPEIALSSKHLSCQNCTVLFDVCFLTSQRSTFFVRCCHD